MKRIDKVIPKKVLILITIAILIILIIIGIALTMARYKSETETVINTDIAFFVTKTTYQEANIFVNDIYPREEPFYYQFTVTNSDGTHVAETSIDYTINLEATTNLPLDFKIYKNNTELTGSNVEQNIVLDSSNQAYIKTIKVNNGNFTYNQVKTDTYKIAVIFPTKYNEYEELEGMIDNINIIVDAKQKIN